MLHNSSRLQVRHSIFKRRVVSSRSLIDANDRLCQIIYVAINAGRTDPATLTSRSLAPSRAQREKEKRKWFASDKEQREKAKEEKTFGKSSSGHCIRLSANEQE
jgi:hypothetical protein